MIEKNSENNPGRPPIAAPKIYINLVNLNEKWHGPGAWRTEGINWSYEYVLRTTGILKTPGITSKNKIN